MAVNLDNAWRHISVNDILAVIPPAHEHDDPRLLPELSDVELTLVTQFVELGEVELRQAALKGAENSGEREKVYQLQGYLRDAMAALTDAGNALNDRSN